MGWGRGVVYGRAWRPFGGEARGPSRSGPSAVPAATTTTCTAPFSPPHQMGMATETNLGWRLVVGGGGREKSLSEGESTASISLASDSDLCPPSIRSASGGDKDEADLDGAAELFRDAMYDS